MDISAYNIYKIANLDEPTPAVTCNRAFKGREYKCLFMENVWTSIKGKVMVINSEYDEVGLE